MSDPREMHDSVNTGQQRCPIDRRGQISEKRRLSADRESGGFRLAHGCARVVACIGQREDQSAPDESGGSGHEHSHCFVPRAKTVRSHATSAPPSTRAVTLMINEGFATVATASPTSATLTTKTRDTT